MDKILTPRSALALVSLLVPLLLTLLLAVPVSAGETLDFVDLMKFRTIDDAVISQSGSWIAYELKPDRGDGQVIVRSTRDQKEFIIERGTGGQIANGDGWVAAKIQPTLEEQETKSDDEKPQSGLVLLNTASGEQTSYERVSSFEFSTDGKWLAIHHTEDPKDETESETSENTGKSEVPGESENTEASTHSEVPAESETPENTEGTELKSEENEVPGESGSESGNEVPGESESAENAGSADQEDEKKKDEHLGTRLTLKHLETGNEVNVDHVTALSFSEDSAYLAYAVAAPEGKDNGVRLRQLTGDSTPELTAATHSRGRYTALAWSETHADLAFISALDDDEGEPGDGELWLWRGQNQETRAVATSADAADGWFIPSVNEVTWARDGQRFFFGYRPKPEATAEATAEATGEATAETFDPYDLEVLLEKREVDVWHWNDPQIQSQQKKAWEQEQKRTYRAVYDLNSGQALALADLAMREVEPSDNPRAVLGYSDQPYLKDITWDGWYKDVYWVSLADGKRQKIVERLADAEASLSPDGRYVAYYSDPHWYLYDADSHQTRNLTASLDVPFANEDHDYPRLAPGYGDAEWLADGSAVLIHDKYDLWRFASADGSAENLTAGTGRSERTRFSWLDLDPETPFIESMDGLLLSGHNELTKIYGLFTIQDGEVQPRLSQPAKKFLFEAKAEDSDHVLLTRQSYREFPDLWVIEGQGEPRKLSNANPQVADYAWGNAELVHWSSVDGTPLDGVLIRPEALEEGERCPVLTYYYRFSSHRLHEFNQPVVNHRPSFPVYASHGYCIFLPDIRFEIGRPGFSATKALVPGVQKLVEMGVADPDALGLHGHSWSGYQTAFVITQTNIFAAAVAGAPVSNMVSAYGGIRWGTGLSRQFQYEKAQSRLGVSLWQGRDLYIDNSPVFFADRIETPLLIQFGDEDGAVPWYQGIELYMAMRRLGKDAVFLQYRSEPHHLKKYANKLDYSIKMKEYFDHYLKGTPAPAWISQGVPYSGK